jgi:hypothetical protein
MPDPFELVGRLNTQPYLLDNLPIHRADEEQLKRLKHRQPPLSECARIGQRQLSWAPWVPGVSKSKGSLLDRHNFELSHEHVFFESSGDNVGWSNNGIFSEQMCQFEYKMDPTCYDGSLMRAALASMSVAPAGFAPSKLARITGLFGFNRLYDFLRNNCQDFVSRALAQYQKLSGSSRL